MNELQNKLPGFAGLLGVILGLTIIAMAGHWLVSDDHLSQGVDWTISNYLFWPLVLGVAWMVAGCCDRFALGFLGALIVELGGIYLAERVTSHLGVTAAALAVVIVGVAFTVRARPQFGPNI
jgi:hypothetical protein